MNKEKESALLSLEEDMNKKIDNGNDPLTEAFQASKTFLQTYFHNENKKEIKENRNTIKNKY